MCRAGNGGVTTSWRGYMRSGGSMRSLGITLALTLTLFSTAALADIISGFTEKVSPDGQTNATEPSVAVDRSDGTVYVAWQASGTHVARSDDGGRSFVQPPTASLLGNEIGHPHNRVGR